MLGGSESKRMRAKLIVYRVPHQFIEGRIGMYLDEQITVRLSSSLSRYEREAWDLYGIFFKDHPDLCVILPIIDLHIY